MKLSLDRTLRAVWLAIGVLVLAALAAALVFAAAGLLRTRGAAPAAERASSASLSAPPRLPAPGAPVRVRGTETRMIPLARGSGGGYGIDGRLEGLANVVFVDPGGGARSLLEGSAVIRALRYPAEGMDPAAHGPWITYEIAHGDSLALWVSAPDGRSLRRVTELPLRYRAHHAWDEARILVHAGEAGRSRAFLYHVAEARLDPLPALDSALARAEGGPHPAR